jgi:aspartyl/asparaginyl-tRNA synthetase
MLSACRRCLHVQSRGVRLKSTSIKSLLKEREIGKDVTVTGWVIRRRKLKNALFLDVNDGSTFQRLQVVLPTGNTPETYGLQAISANFSVTIGSSVRVTGEVVASGGGPRDIELHGPTATVLGTSEESPQVPPTSVVADMSDFHFK